MKILMSKQQQNDFYSKLIESKNADIEQLRKEVDLIKAKEIESFHQSKREISLLQDSLTQALETHQRHITLSNDQVNSLKELGLSL